MYIGEKNGKFSYLAEGSRVFDELHYINAGKIRRYHGESPLRKLTDIKTIALNIRDIVQMLRGTLQSIILFRRLHANGLLLKGGYVCVPVSFGARFAKVPMITHDSDAMPGLSNRIASRFAKYHATAMPAKYYRYPSASVKHVGLPVDLKLFRKYSESEKRLLREKFEISADNTVLLITGGSNGARRLNQWCIELLPELLDKYPKLKVIHLVGEGNESQYDQVHPTYLDRINVLPNTNEMHHLIAVSDIVVTRAGASSLVELATQSKACVIVPNPDLSGGHQLKNAVVYKDQEAGLVVQEKDLSKNNENLKSSLTILIENPDTRTRIGENLRSTLPEKSSATELARLLQGLAS